MGLYQSFKQLWLITGTVWDRDGNKQISSSCTCYHDKKNRRRPTIIIGCSYRLSDEDYVCASFIDEPIIKVIFSCLQLSEL
jgi:hypothetical protein